MPRLPYTEHVSERRVKFAWLLLLLMFLDLSTASLCTAGTFPMLGAPEEMILSGSGAVHGQPVQNVDDDGCFCCCTHMLPGTHSVFSPPVHAVPVNLLTAALNPLAVVQSLFHPPKR